MFMSGPVDYSHFACSHFMRRHRFIYENLVLSTPGPRVLALALALVVVVVKVLAKVLGHLGIDKCVEK